MFLGARRQPVRDTAWVFGEVGSLDDQDSIPPSSQRVAVHRPALRRAAVKIGDALGRIVLSANPYNVMLARSFATCVCRVVTIDGLCPASVSLSWEGSSIHFHCAGGPGCASQVPLTEFALASVRVLSPEKMAPMRFSSVSDGTSRPSTAIPMSQPVARPSVREGLIVTVTLSPARIVSGPQPICLMNAIESVSIRQERASLHELLRLIVMCVQRCGFQQRENQRCQDAEYPISPHREHCRYCGPCWPLPGGYTPNSLRANE